MRGIITTPEAQLIFVDTPGIHKPHHQLGEVLVRNAKIAIDSVDVVLFVVDGSTNCGAGDRYIADLLSKDVAGKNETSQTLVILGLNKIDKKPQDSCSIDESYRNWRHRTNGRLWSFLPKHL